MKKTVFICQFGIMILTISAVGCHKSLSNASQQNISPDQEDSITQIQIDTLPLVPFPRVPLTGCSFDPDYGDTIVFPQPATSQDYIVAPVNNPGAGKYISWPGGMMIDSLTGAIDVTKSNTGERYEIGFIKSGTTDTCMIPLIIGGAAYMDSVYVLGEGATQSLPYYDANPSMASICSGQTGANSCSFDVTGSAASQKVIVNTSTGVIDLQQTIDGTGQGKDGAFGHKPKNGQTISTTIFYRLNDASNMALQQIQLDLVYYDAASNMNQGQKKKIDKKHKDAETNNLIFGGGNPRPPLIVIVRRL